MKKKKVIFFIYQFGSGGAARTFLNILNYMDRNKFEPMLVTLDFEGNYEFLLKEDVSFVKLKTKRLRSAILPLARLIRKEKPDLVFSTIPVYNTVALLAKMLSFTRTKVIVREAALLGGNFKQNLSLFFFGRIYRLASRIIALSKGVKENIIHRYFISEKRIDVIYNPIDLEKIENLAKEEILAEHEHIFSQTNQKTLVTAGRFVREKDHQTLIRALYHVNKKIAAQLVILGEGELEEELKDLTKELNLEEKVHFLGFQQNPYPYFKRADIFVLSSTREGFGHVLVEALAVGTPVVSTDCYPGSQEVLAKGAYGTIARVGDPLDLAKRICDTLQLSNAEKSRRIENGYKRAGDFCVQRIVRQYEEVFLKEIEGFHKIDKRKGRRRNG